MHKSKIYQKNTARCEIFYWNLARNLAIPVLLCYTQHVCLNFLLKGNLQKAVCKILVALTKESKEIEGMKVNPSSTY